MFFKKIINSKKNLHLDKEVLKVSSSEFFDEKYYLEKNADVREANIDPATHFYLYGWKEYRNPSEKIDIKKFLEDNPKIKELNINPIVYILKNKINIRDEYSVKKIENEKISIKNLLEKYFFESNPLKTLPVEFLGRRINIIFNGFDYDCFFGGKLTALLLVTKFAQKHGYRLRVIAQKPKRKIFFDFLELFKINFDGEIEFYSSESTKFLEIGAEDHFVCTMWSNADSILKTRSIKGKIFYIMQEVESFFYDHGDYHLRCYNTLTNNRLIPIVNSKLLYEYLIEHGYGNVKRNGVYFEPAFSRDLLKPSKDSFKKKTKYKLFFYARPSHQRNLFYFGIDILNKTFLTGILKSKEWIVYVAGDKTVCDFKFEADVEVKNLGIMDWKSYCKFTSKTDLCYSMIYTPHPSYPPLDFASSGAVVLTNKYENKKDLHKYSKNIISADLNEEDMLKKFKRASLLVKNIQQRKNNYKESRIKDSWDDSFKNIFSYMEKKINEKKD